MDLEEKLANLIAADQKLQDSIAAEKESHRAVNKKKWLKSLKAGSKNGSIVYISELDLYDLYRTWSGNDISIHDILKHKKPFNGKVVHRARIRSIRSRQWEGDPCDFLIQILDRKVKIIYIGWKYSEINKDSDSKRVVYNIPFVFKTEAEALKRTKQLLKQNIKNVTADIKEYEKIIKGCQVLLNNLPK